MMKQDSFFDDEESSKTPSEGDPKQLPQTFVEGYLDDIKERPHFAVEANFMFLPIFCFDRKSSDKRSKVTHSVPVVVDGKIMTSSIAVSTGNVLKDGVSVNPGLPGAFDMQVLFCLMDMWDEQGRAPDGSVKFHLAALTKRLNLQASGRSYGDLKHSIKKLAVTNIESVNSLFSSEKAGYINTVMSILEDPLFITAKAGRSPVDTCTVSLSKFILKNLLNNYSGQINRRIYQSLDISFSQRILILFWFHQQLKRESDHVDFEIFDLAKMIPISGKLYPSKIKERLQTGLKELSEKKVLRHQFIEIGKKVVIRLTPYEKVNVYLEQASRLKTFVKMCEHVYGVNPLEKFGLSDEIATVQAEKYSKVIEFGERKYLWFFHVLDVAMCMLANGYNVKSPVAFLKTLLETQASKLDYPMNFVPVDVKSVEKQNKEELTKTLVIKEIHEKDAEEELFRLSANYATMLTDAGREHYIARVKATSPQISIENKQLMDFEIADLISDDIKQSRDVTKHLDEKKLKVVKQNVASIDQLGNT